MGPLTVQKKSGSPAVKQRVNFKGIAVRQARGQGYGISFLIKRPDFFLRGEKLTAQSYSACEAFGELPFRYSRKSVSVEIRNELPLNVSG